MTWWQILILVVVGIVALAWLTGASLLGWDNHKAYRSMTHVERLAFKSGRNWRADGSYPINAVDWVRGVRPEQRRAQSRAIEAAYEAKQQAKARRKDGVS